MVPLSVLDLSPIIEGGDAAQSLSNSLDLARHTERLGYRRYWLAEHHNSAGIASAATAVVIAHVAAGTSTIRVGAGNQSAGQAATATKSSIPPGGSGCGFSATKWMVALGGRGCGFRTTSLMHTPGGSG